MILPLVLFQIQINVNIPNTDFLLSKCVIIDEFVILKVYLTNFAKKSLILSMFQMNQSFE